MEYVIDIQGFKTALNKFIFKEVAIIPLEGDSTPAVFLFKPPHPWRLLQARNKCENLWLQRNFHGLSWESGDIAYEEVQKTLRVLLHDAVKIYIKGLEKMKWVQQMLPCDKVLCNVEDLGCPSFKTSTDFYQCTNHDKFLYAQCAYSNVQFIKDWITKNNNDCIKLMYT